MRPEIRLVVSQKNKIVENITTPVQNDFVKTIENIQAIANNVLTKLIEDKGDKVEDINMVDDEASESEEEDLGSTPVKKKK